MIFPARELVALGFELLATSGTAEVLKRNGINATVVRKQCEGDGPDGEQTIVQLIHDGEVDLIVNTPVRHRRPPSTATRSVRRPCPPCRA